MNARELVHHWAHQTKPRGKASALSFEGPVIYSYSTAIGRILAPGMYLVNTATFSVTTSGKHQGPMRRAIPHSAVTLYYEDDRRNTSLEPSGADVVNYNFSRIGDYCGRASRARQNKGWLLQQAEIAVDCTRQAASFYNVPLPDGFEEIAARIHSEAAAGAELQKEINAQIEAQKEKAASEKLAQWLAGENVRVPSLSHARFRPMPGESTRIESTQGVVVPTHDFIRALRFAMARRNKEWRANGETCPVGNYQLNSISASGVVAGCHRVTWSEIDRLASILL
jgi:hypothetical protein